MASGGKGRRQQKKYLQKMAAKKTEPIAGHVPVPPVAPITVVGPSSMDKKPDTPKYAYNGRLWVVIIGLAGLSIGQGITIYNLYEDRPKCKLVLMTTTTSTWGGSRGCAVLFSGTISNPGKRTLFMRGYRAIITLKNGTVIPTMPSVIPNDFKGFPGPEGKVEYKDASAMDISKKSKLAAGDDISGNLLFLIDSKYCSALHTESEYRLDLTVIDDDSKEYHASFEIEDNSDTPNMIREYPLNGVKLIPKGMLKESSHK